MVLEVIFGIIILAIIAFVAFRVAHSIALGILLIGLVFLASYLVVGSFPDSQSIPIIGQFFKFIPSFTGSLANIGNGLFKINIVGTARDSQNNLIVFVENNGVFDVSGFRVLADNKTTDIKNNPKDPLRAGEQTSLQTNWNSGFTSLVVETNQTKATYQQ